MQLLEGPRYFFTICMREKKKIRARGKERNYLINKDLILYVHAFESICLQNISSICL